MGVRLLIGSEVVAALGGPRAARAALARVTAATFTCTQCHQRGVFADEPAAVVVRVTHLGSGRVMPVVGFAHPGCSGSRVQQVGALTPAGYPAVHAIGWVHDSDGRQPTSVVLLGPAVTETATTDGGERIDLLMAALHGDGFVTVPDLVSPLPVLPGLLAEVTAGRLVVTVPTGHYLYDGPPVGDDRWAKVAAGRGQVTVLVASGMRLDSPDRDQMADLFTAIGRALVAGAVAEYTTGPPGTAVADRPPWRSGRARRRGGRRR
jgi:hypothetical protein